MLRKNVNLLIFCFWCSMTFLCDFSILFYTIILLIIIVMRKNKSSNQQILHEIVSHTFFLCCTKLFNISFIVIVNNAMLSTTGAGKQRKWLFSFKVIKESQKGIFPSNFPSFVPPQIDRKRNTDEAVDFPVEKFSFFSSSHLPFLKYSLIFSGRTDFNDFINEKN